MVPFAPALLACLVSPAAPAPFDPVQANQMAAIATLRTIAAAQAELQAIVAVDTDCDGVGEYGYFEELAGTYVLRVCCAGIPCSGSWGIDELDPPLLRPAFGLISNRRIFHRGYVFQMWLPHATAGGTVAGIPEDVVGGKAAAPYPDPDNGARLWCCYAWPVDYGLTGRRAYFINQRGVVLECQNRSVVPYDGDVKAPLFDEAFSNSHDMGSPLRVGIAGGNDDTIWTLVD